MQRAAHEGGGTLTSLSVRPERIFLMLPEPRLQGRQLDVVLRRNWRDAPSKQVAEGRADAGLDQHVVQAQQEAWLRSMLQQALLEGGVGLREVPEAAGHTPTSSRMLMSVGGFRPTAGMQDGFQAGPRAQAAVGGGPGHHLC